MRFTQVHRGECDMKRQCETNETAVAATLKRPKLQSVTEKEPIERAIETALYKRDGDGTTELSIQPILLRARCDYREGEFTLAYWPYDVETATKLLARLDETKYNEVDMEEHITLTDTLLQIACGTIADDEMKSRRERLEKVCGCAYDEIGLFALVKTDFYGRLHGEYIAEYDRAELFVITSDQLSPHLYTQECLLFEF